MCEVVYVGYMFVSSGTTLLGSSYIVWYQSCVDDYGHRVFECLLWQCGIYTVVLLVYIYNGTSVTGYSVTKGIINLSLKGEI